MDIISGLLAPLQWPSGAWETIIGWFSGIGNIGVAIILLTLCVKVLMLPVDFWQRSITRKMSLQQAEMQPELQKIQQKYGKSELGQQKTQELYKKYGVSPTSSCGGMLVYMVLTFAIFLTLFSALGNISKTQINYEYYQLQTEYATVYKQTGDKIQAQDAVVEKYDDIRQGFLSIKNIWRPDNWSSVFPSASEFISTTGTNFYVEKNTESDFYNFVMISTDTSTPYIDINGNAYRVPSEDPTTDPATITIEGIANPVNIIYADSSLVTEHKTIQSIALGTAKEQFKLDFNDVTTGINKKYEGQWNGFLILILLSGAATFLSQFLSTLGAKQKNQKGEEVKAAKPKIMSGLILSGVMIAFTISYTSLFALYITTSNILSILFNYIINLINNKIDGNKKGKTSKKEKVVVADYVRID